MSFSQAKETGAGIHLAGADLMASGTYLRDLCCASKPFYSCYFVSIILNSMP